MKIERGQVALVTGAASGIGLGLATRFAEMGLNLVLADLDGAGLDAAASALSAHGVEVATRRTNVGDAAEMEALRDLAEARFGGVDLLCNNAGIVSPFMPLWESPLGDWERVMAANLWGVIHGIRLFVPGMVARGRGHVVNTASMAGLIVVPYNGVYNATKYGVVSLSETLKADLAAGGHRVGVTVLCPGMVHTNINAAPDVKDSMPPLPEGMAYLEPADVARQVVAAVESDHLFLTTHAGSHEAIRMRADQLLAETASPL